MYKPSQNTALYITVSIIIAFTIIICVACSGAAVLKLQTALDYYFVYQYTADNAVSASSLSSATESLGGAGYILTRDSEYYIIVSCYYDETSANSVCFNLKTRGHDCGVLAVSVTEKNISRANLSNAELFSGNINTLEQLGRLCYLSANNLDKGEITQSGALDALASVQSGLKGLYLANAANCFSDALSNLLTICGEILDENYIYSKDARKLQIAIIDGIINVELT